MDEVTISIGDLLAVLARKGKQIICCSILFALLLGGVKGFITWLNLNDEEYVNLDQVAYEQEKLKLERIIETANRGISNQEDYIASSLWMDINPYDKHTTELYLQISGINENDVTMTFGDTITPRDYLLSRIMTQYSVLWSAENLSQALNLQKYESISDRYLREVVSVNFLDNGVIRVFAVGNSEAETSELANAVAELLMRNSDTVRENSFDHIISVFNTVQQNQIDTEMAEAQYANYVKIDNYNDSIIAAEEAMIKELEKPDSTPVAVIKMAIIGGIVSGVLACVWYIGKVFLTESVQSSAHMERALSVPFIGTMVRKNGVFQWLSNLFSAERVWKDESQSLEYIVEMVKFRLPGKKLLLASTLNLEKCSEKVEKLRGVLSAAGIQTDFVDDVLHRPRITVALHDCDSVLLLEQIDNTRLNQVTKMCRLSEECTKSVIGFVIL